MIKFDDTMGCVVRATTPTQPQDKYFLGKKTHKEVNPTIGIEIMFETDAKLQTFLNFYTVILKGGTELFQIDLPYFGKTKKLTVSFFDNFTLQEGAIIEKASFVLEIFKIENV